MTGDTFLAMMQNNALRHVPMEQFSVVFVPFWTGSSLTVG